MRGFVAGSRGDAQVIELPDEEDYGVYRYMRERGASRGVAREAVAAQRQKTLDLLTGWYGNGWEWWGVECCFDALGEEFVASCYGIDDYDYADNYMRREIAEEVAAQLEAAGYTVTDLPEPEKTLDARRVRAVVSSKGIEKKLFPHSQTREEWRAEWKRNLHSQDWSD